MRFARSSFPWWLAAVCCALAVAARQWLIQPPEVAHQCDATTLSLFGAGPWWCGVRAAIIMTYAWGGLLYASLGLSVATLAWRRSWLAAVTLVVGALAIVWYTYEPGALAITVGALVLARTRHDAARSGLVAPAR